MTATRQIGILLGLEQTVVTGHRHRHLAKQYLLRIRRTLLAAPFLSTVLQVGPEILLPSLMMMLKLDLRRLRGGKTMRTRVASQAHIAAMPLHLLWRYHSHGIFGSMPGLGSVQMTWAARNHRLCGAMVRKIEAEEPCHIAAVL